MDERNLSPARQIVTVMRRLYRAGLTTTSGGNLSVREPDGTVWITPSGIDKGSLTEADIMRISPDGSTDGSHKPSVESPFHLGAYRVRKDFSAVLHAHSPSLVAFCTANRIPDVRFMPSVERLIGNNGKIARIPPALPGTDSLQKNVCAAFESGCNLLFLDNHGVVVGSDSLFRALRIFEALDNLANILLKASTLGFRPTPPGISCEAPFPDMLPACPHTPFDGESLLREKMAGFVRRGVERGLFTAGQGTLSCRTPEGFLITPQEADNFLLQPEELVSLHISPVLSSESGKLPSDLSRLHGEIYRAHPEVNCVITAVSPEVMAFAMGSAAPDTRFVLESRIVVREAVCVPYAELQTDSAPVLQALSPHVPAVLVGNSSVTVTASSLLSAFDRLEVLEGAARSIREANLLGGPVSLPERDIADVERVYPL